MGEKERPPGGWRKIKKLWAGSAALGFGLGLGTTNVGCRHADHPTNEVQMTHYSPMKGNSFIAREIDAQMEEWGMCKISYGNGYAVVPVKLVMHKLEELTGVHNLDKLDFEQVVEGINHPKMSTLMPVFQNVAKDVVGVDTKAVAADYVHKAQRAFERAGFKVSIEPLRSSTIPKTHWEAVMYTVDEFKRSGNGSRVLPDPELYKVAPGDTVGAHILRDDERGGNNFRGRD